MVRTALRESAKQVPALTVMTVIVYLFLGALSDNNTFISKLSDSCHATHRVSSEVIKENTKQLGRVERALDDTILMLAKMNGR